MFGYHQISEKLECLVVIRSVKSWNVSLSSDQLTVEMFGCHQIS